MKVVQILAAEDAVGDSIVWDNARARLVCADISGRRIHGFNPATGAPPIWPTQGRPTSIDLRVDGGAILGMKRHI